jgi:hypothetical protein
MLDIDHEGVGIAVQNCVPAFKIAMYNLIHELHHVYFAYVQYDASYIGWPVVY